MFQIKLKESKRIKKVWKKIWSLTLIMAFVLMGSVIFDGVVHQLSLRAITATSSAKLNYEAFKYIEMLGLTPQARAIGFLPIVLTLLSPLMSQALNPSEHHVFAASAPSLALKTPDGIPIPGVLSLRETAVLLRQGTKISKFKVGINGKRPEKVDFYIDDCPSTRISLEAEPFSVGTDFVSTDSKNAVYDTASPGWNILEWRYLQFEAVSDGHPVYNFIPVMAVNDDCYTLAATSEEYRSYLAQSLGAIPSIPIATAVSAEGRVSHPLASSQINQAQLQNSQPGIVQPNRPVQAQINEGLSIHAFVRGQEVSGGELRLTKNDQIDFKVGNLSAQNCLIISGSNGRELYRKVLNGAERPPLSFSRSQPGAYLVQLQTKGSDGVLGEVLQLHITIQK